MRAVWPSWFLRLEPALARQQLFPYQRSCEISFSSGGFGATARREHTSLCCTDMGRRLAWREVGPSQIAPG
jgi:hypothetical protein